MKHAAVLTLLAVATLGMPVAGSEPLNSATEPPPLSDPAAPVANLPPTAQTQAIHSSSDEPYWTPDASLIARLEAGLKIMPLLHQASFQLAQYDRYYAGVTINRRRAVRGRLIIPPNREDHPKTGIHITDAKYLPQLLGGGCGNVFVTYWVDQDFSSGQCSPTDAYAPTSAQPHWKPDEATATHMELAIGEFLHRTHPTLPDLSQYSRYYWGVTLDGDPTIEGRIIRLSTDDATLHLSDNSDSGPRVSDGGCSNIHVEYDVKSASLTQLACDGEPQAPL